MQKILISQLPPNAILGRDLFDSRGRLLLGRGTALTARSVGRLIELGIVSVYIKNDLWHDVETPEIIRDEVRGKARRSMQSVFESTRKQLPLDVHKIQKTAGLIIDEILTSPGAMVHLTDIRTLDGYTLGHSINVCVLAVLIGVKLNYNNSRLRDLATGALLHDVGKLVIPPAILNKPDKLTEEEFIIMKEHSVRGYEILRKQYHDLSFPAIHMAFQHQEKFDGSGYPRGLKGHEIHEFSRIAAIADVYDALTAERVYKKALPPHEACEIMGNGADTHFDGELLRIFLDQVAIYPVSSMVSLTSGEIGIVTHVSAHSPSRPVIRLIYDKNRAACRPESTLDLQEYPTCFVDKVFTAEETARLLKDYGSQPQEA